MANLKWKYKVIPKLLNGAELKLAHEYCKQKHITNLDSFDEVQNNCGDTKFYKDPLMEVFLRDKKKILEKNINLQLHETYTYWRYYCFGSKLTKHTDRPACQISVTANIKSYDEWPIVVEGNSINLKEGQAILYYGCLAKHWRPGIYKGDGMAQVFFHYVDANGPFYHHEQDKYLLSTGNIASENDEKIVEEMTKKFYEGRK
jgi:hypothetical protein